MLNKNKRGRVKTMTQLINDIMSNISNFGYLGYVIIISLIAVENIFPPIPSEVILTLGGIATTGDEAKLTKVGVIIAATVGSLLGAVILYWMGRIFDIDRMERWVDSKLGRALRFKKGDVEKAYTWFEKKGKWSVFFGRCVPIVRSLISIPAGMSKMSWGSFLLMTAAGSLVWNTILVYLGAAFGNSYTTIISFMDRFSTITEVVLIVIALGLGAWFIKARMFSSKNKEK